MSDTQEPTPAPEGVSPLAEADPLSINALISEDRLADIINKPPLLASDRELMQVVAYYRAGRARYAKESAERANAAPARRGGPKPKSVAEAIAQRSILTL